ncbi:MAG TPA: NYN domain-containing protein [Coleofasciculaceae cyanobacterium]
MITKLIKETSEDTILKQQAFYAKQPSNASLHNQGIEFSTSASDTALPVSVNRGRVAIFIDGSNLFYAALQLGIEIDYAKLLCHLTQGSRLLRAFFYTGVDRVNEKQQGFLLWMRRNGYRVVTKDLIQLPDGSKKANLDVEIAVDMMTLSGHYDTAVLVSGDGDLSYAVNTVSYRGARVEVVSLRSMTSDSLINVADVYTDIAQLKPQIQKSAVLGYTHQPLSS